MTPVLFWTLLTNGYFRWFLTILRILSIHFAFKWADDWFCIPYLISTLTVEGFYIRSLFLHKMLIIIINMCTVQFYQKKSIYYPSLCWLKIGGRIFINKKILIKSHNLSFLWCWKNISISINFLHHRGRTIWVTFRNILQHLQL